VHDHDAIGLLEEVVPASERRDTEAGVVVVRLRKREQQPVTADGDIGDERLRGPVALERRAVPAREQRNGVGARVVS
jgi:hypothetical protein